MTQATEIKALYGTSLNIAVAEQVMGWRRRTGENTPSSAFEEAYGIPS